MFAAEPYLIPALMRLISGKYLHECDAFAYIYLLVLYGDWQCIITIILWTIQCLQTLITIMLSNTRR